MEYVKKRYTTSLIIFYFLLLEGLQIVPMSFLTLGFFSGISTDGALLVLLGLAVIRGPIWFKNPIRYTAVGKAIIFFMYYAIVNVLYGVIVQRYSFIDVFRGARDYLFMLTFFMFSEVPLKTIVRVIRILIIIVAFQSVLYLLQIYTGHEILQAGSTTQYMTGIGYHRFMNVPRLLSFAMAVCFFWFPFTGFIKKYRNLLLVLLIVTFIGPLPRAGIICWFAAIIIYSFIYEGYLKRSIYLIGAGIAALMLSYVDIISKRFSSVMDQLSVLNELFSNQQLEAVQVADGNTFLYRLNHLLERLAYINTHSLGWLFGIGFLDEKAPQAQELPFKYGLINPDTHHVLKIFTVDLIWSPALLLMGYVGTIIFLNIYLKILRNYSRINASIKVSKVIFILVVLSFLVSFTSDAMIDAEYYVPILMLVVLLEKKKQYDQLPPLNLQAA